MRILDHENQSKDYRRAKELRRSASLCEKLLWSKLSRTARQTGLKFRRQYPLHPYIADFICLHARLIIELDGMSHDARQVYDQKRSDFLQNRGYTILRFSNDEVQANLESVVLAVLIKARELSGHNTEDTLQLNAPSPNPSRKGRGIRPVPAKTAGHETE